MNIQSIEPTPSPNTMKVILSEELPAGSRNNYTKDNSDQAPEIIQDILGIEGVKGVYHVADFLAVERNARFDWKAILSEVRAAFGETDDNQDTEDQRSLEGFGEVKVFVQMFQGIPMQVKLTDGDQEKRVGLPERFMKAILSAQEKQDNVVLEREWKEHGVRYGDLEAVGIEIVEELSATFTDERLEKMLKQEDNTDKLNTIKSKERYKVTLEMLDEPDWSKRFAALDQMDPKPDDIPVLAKALEDEKGSIRRLATVYFGMLEESDILLYLSKALKDKSVTVRRTAGDCMSDLGDKAAMPAMIEALKDKNKLVRWRAAMFLYEVGDESALPALREAENDPEFEVSMQVKMAIQRIEGGEEAKGSVWKQMTERNN
ncbi:virulence factor [Sutcliffiella horikoshii]|uniref:Virulence factor n=1 Tax=Sutcliffiella horikoshii TaxID=79883 RepID=A0ABN4ZEG4_9BACI|nr:conserved virulence factor C family protein [Sutcliffiella horikoshii]ART76767.1 virulence factor [Sutcliffiella horikoshii]